MKKTSRETVIAERRVRLLGPEYALMAFAAETAIFVFSLRVKRHSAAKAILDNKCAEGF